MVPSAERRNVLSKEELKGVLTLLIASSKIDHDIDA